MERKTFAIKDATVNDAGHVNFRFAKLGVMDKGNDVIDPGAFENGKQILLSSWNHSSWGNGLSVGKGTIQEKDGYAVFDGDFNLKSAAGKDHYETVKFNGDLQEYSFGFDVLASQDMMYCASCQKQVSSDTCPTCGTMATKARRLMKLSTFEASPVLLGQGIDTGTNNIKSLETKGAIPYHDYGKADEGAAWDGPKEVAAADVTTLKKICTWFDSESPDVKSSYKLPHHHVDGLKAVWRGVAAAMGRLAGAKIPDGDKKACYSHLAKHYKEFDKEPPSFDALEAGELKFIDHAAFVLVDAQEFLIRARSVSDWKAGLGKDIGVNAKALIQQMAEEAKALGDELVRLVKLDDTGSEAAALLARVQFNLMEIEGVLQ
jgi:hypothetical protein